MAVGDKAAIMAVGDETAIMAVIRTKRPMKGQRP